MSYIHVRVIKFFFAPVVLGQGLVVEKSKESRTKRIQATAHVHTCSDILLKPLLQGLPLGVVTLVVP